MKTGVLILALAGSGIAGVVVVSSGVHPTRSQLARVVGQHRSQTELAAVR